MATVTAGALIAAGLRRADMVDAVDGFIQHPPSGGGEAFDYLTAALSELYDTLYEDPASGYSLNKPTFSTVAGVADHPLDTVAGTTFYRLDGVEYWDGSRWVPLTRVYSDAQRAAYIGTGYPRGYGIEGVNLTIYPTPSAVFQMRLRTESLPPTVTADTDLINLQGPWREFVELHFCVQCLEKEESDTSAQMARLYGTPMNPGGLKQRIRDGARRRDNNKPLAPVDVQGEDAGLYPYRWPY